MDFAKRFKSLPVSTKKLLGLGVVLGMVVALPLFIWAITTQNFNPFKSRASGEPVVTPLPTGGGSPSIYSPAGECGYCGDIGNIPCQDGLSCTSQVGNVIFPDDRGLCLKNDGTSVCTPPFATAPTFYCIQHPPTFEIVPQSQPGSPGSTLVYSTLIRNNDEFVLADTPGAAVCRTSFGAPKLVGNLPSGWTGTFNQTTFGINPQKTGTVPFSVTSPTSPAPAAGPVQFTVDLQTLTSSTTLASASGVYEVLATPNTNPPLCAVPQIPSGYLDTGSTLFSMAFYAGGSQGNGTAVDGYRWDYDGNGTWDVTSIGIGTGTTFHYQFVQPGIYHPIYQVHNNSGLWSGNCEYPRTITVNSPNTMRPFEIFFRFDGVNDDSASQPRVNNDPNSAARVNVIFVSRSLDNYVGYETGPLLATYNSNGVYTLNFQVPTNYLPAANDYAVILVGEKHLHVKFCRSGQTDHCSSIADGEIAIPSGGVVNSLNFIGIPLPAGDTPTQDGKVDTSDFNLIKSLTSKISTSLTYSEKLIGDLNYDGKVNTQDLFLIRRTLETRYD